MGNILLLPFSHHLKETIKGAIPLITGIENILIVCQSKEESLACTDAKYAQHLVVLADPVEGMTRQVERIYDFLRKRVNTNDQLFVYLEGNTALEHTILYVCGILYKKQTIVINKFEQIKIESKNRTENEFYVLKEHIRELVHSGNYRSASTLAKNQLKNNSLIQLLQFGENLFRMDLTYQPSMGELHPITLLLNTMHTEIEGVESEKKYLQQFIHLQKGDQKAFIFFLHNYAEFLYEQRDTIDFIVIFYRLVEETLLYALGWDIDSSQNAFCRRKNAVYSLRFPEWKLTKHYHRYSKALRQYVRKIENTKKVSIQQGAQRRIELLIGEEMYFVELYLFFQDKRLNRCIEFRHEGVSGHGFADLTKAELEEICGGVSPLKLFEPVLNRYDLKPGKSIFTLLNKAIMLGLHEEERIQSEIS